MNEVSAFIGLDVHKETVSVAVADPGRNGEIRHLGNFPNSPDAIGKLARRLKRQHAHAAVEFVYETPSNVSYPGLALFAAFARHR